MMAFCLSLEGVYLVFFLYLFGYMLYNADLYISIFVEIVGRRV